MARKSKKFSREILPDPKFGDVVITKMINCLMSHGKKGVAEKSLYLALDKLAEKNGGEGVDSFRKALGNIRPMVEVRSRRVGGATYQVPTEGPTVRAQSLAIRWLVEASNQRTERTLGDRLAAEMLDAMQGRGIAMKKKEDTHRMAEANKAFAHFRW
jgi:small subunit ribosomal protein S7